MNPNEQQFRPMKMPAKKAQAEGDENNGGLGDLQLKKKRELGQNPQEGMEFSGKTSKESLAKDILRQGYIQSYIDFYYITNPGQVDPHNKDFPEERLLELQKALIHAEEFTRFDYPDKTTSIEGYFSLAEQFYDDKLDKKDDKHADNKDPRDFQVSAYFYKRVIQIAQSVEEKQWEGRGKLGYGQCYDQLDKTREAIEILERSMEEAKNQNPPLTQIIEIISHELIKIYQKMAKTFEKGEDDNISNALLYYSKCLEVAQSGEKPQEEGNICHKIGMLYFKNGNYTLSIEFQNKFLSIANQSNSEEGRKSQMEANASLAQCFLKLGNNQDAEEHLEKYMKLAQSLKMNNALSDAALHLATLYAQKGDTKKSLEFYKQHFDGARTQKPAQKQRQLVDRARVTYGLAKANATIETHINLVKDSDQDLKSLLEWKAKKEK